MALLIPQEEAVVAVQRGAQLPPPRGGDGLQHAVEAVEAGAVAWRMAPATRIRVWAAATVVLMSRVMGGGRVEGRWGGAYALL